MYKRQELQILTLFILFREAFHIHQYRTQQIVCTTGTQINAIATDSQCRAVSPRKGREMIMILTVITVRYGSVDISVLTIPTPVNRAVYGIGVQAPNGYAKFFMAE